MAIFINLLIVTVKSVCSVLRFRSESLQYRFDTDHKSERLKEFPPWLAQIEQVAQLSMQEFISILRFNLPLLKHPLDSYDCDSFYNVYDFYNIWYTVY